LTGCAGLRLRVVVEGSVRADPSVVAFGPMGDEQSPAVVRIPVPVSLQVGFRCVLLESERAALVVVAPVRERPTSLPVVVCDEAGLVARVVTAASAAASAVRLELRVMAFLLDVRANGIARTARWTGVPPARSPR
jgi:hypothetical protein